MGQYHQLLGKPVLCQRLANMVAPLAGTYQSRLETVGLSELKANFIGSLTEAL